MQVGISRDDFERTLRIYLGHQFVAGNIGSISAEAAVSEAPSLKIDHWKAFRFDEVFTIKKGYYNKKPPEATGTDDLVPFIGATEFNNGLTSLHNLNDVLLYSRNGEEKPDEPKGRKIFLPKAITVSNNGSVGFAFYQPKEFTCSHDVNPLYLLEREASPEIGMFICTIIGLDRYRWGYGRKWRPIRMPHSIIKLPSTSEGKPDWDFMEAYVKALPFSISL